MIRVNLIDSRNKPLPVVEEVTNSLMKIDGELVYDSHSSGDGESYSHGCGELGTHDLSGEKLPCWQPSAKSTVRLDELSVDESEGSEVAENEYGDDPHYVAAQNAPTGEEAEAGVRERCQALGFLKKDSEHGLELSDEFDDDFDLDGYHTVDLDEEDLDKIERLMEDDVD